MLVMQSMCAGPLQMSLGLSPQGERGSCRADLDGRYDRQLVHLLQVLLHAAALNLEHILVRRAQLEGLQGARQPATTPEQPSATVHRRLDQPLSVCAVCMAQLVSL